MQPAGMLCQMPSIWTNTNEEVCHEAGPPFGLDEFMIYDISNQKQHEIKILSKHLSELYNRRKDNLRSV